MNDWYGEFVRLARRNSMECLERLMEVARSGEDPKHVIAACKTILNIVTAKSALDVKDAEFTDLTPQEQVRVLTAALDEAKSSLGAIN